ncbi:MAG: glycine cleavage system protein GcvH [Chloroflexi bacterium]|nr:glycine cleavage system protein GcvH [Chloroflexota bacterium]MYG90971.1 glycine cleavage system protein GcvH [Chloroflexota bacterium]MYJ92675.1 glycine cleavage system protein GcvH [Chloroflexota bacterium]
MEYEIPADLLYTPDHEWLRRDPDREDEVTIGITEFAQEQLGDVVYLELPTEGTELTAGAPFGEIESAKTVAELFAPVSGELIGVNGELEDRPELVNESPFDEGWIVRVRTSKVDELDSLLDADAYRALIPED